METRDRIMSELRKNASGYTISELSVKLGISRQTVANCFAYFEGAGKVEIRRVGMAKLYYWRERK